MTINGNIDACVSGRLHGWVICRETPETRLELEVMCCGQLMGQCRADLYREDLKLAGLGDGRYGYSFNLPSELPPAALRSIRLRLKGSSAFLLQSLPQPEDDELTPVFQHLSRFGGLWIDRIDWIDRLGRHARSGTLSDEMGLRIMSFVRDGHIVLRGAVGPGTVAAVNAGIDRQWKSPANGLMMRADRYDGADTTRKAELAGQAAGNALADAHLALPELDAAMAAPPLLDFLAAIFGRAPALAASAARVCAAPRPFIQDSVLGTDADNPLALATAWLALSNTQQGDGSPILLTGSHRVRDFLFRNSGKLLRDCPEQLGNYAAWMRQATAAGNHIRHSPELRAGDIVVCHADLLHGSEPKAGSVAARGVAGWFRPA